MKSLFYITLSKGLYPVELGCLALFLTACGSNKPMATYEPMPHATVAPEKLPGEKGLGAINFRYFNKSTEAELEIDLGNTDVYIEMSGKPKITPTDSNSIKSAQELFYQKRYPEALGLVKQALDANPTAEGNALAGSIHYMMGNNSLARRYWQIALQLNPNLPEVANMLDRLSNSKENNSDINKPKARSAAPRASAKAPAKAIETKADITGVDNVNAPTGKTETIVTPPVEDENAEASIDKPIVDSLKNAHPEKKASESKAP